MKQRIPMRNGMPKTMNDMKKLIKKYNVAGPRYTSYPTVPYWETNPTVEQWKQEVKHSFDKTNASNGISIYMHLPFCESLCTFCSCNKRITKNHSVEEIYLRAIIKEWKMYVNLFEQTPRIKEIHLGGGTPTFFSPEHLEHLIKEVLSEAVVCENPEFSFEAHPNNTAKEHLLALYNVGFRRLSLGVQDLDPQVQEIINRIQPYENVERVVNDAREIGFTSINFDLIYGLPLQTKSGVVNTIEKVITLQPDRIAFYSYAHVPWIKNGQRKFTDADLPRDEEKRELYETGRQLFEQNGYVEIGMDHFALKRDSLYKSVVAKSLHRNFMGYSHSYTELMLGLGVSAISDTWYAYAQNVKELEDYYKHINAEELPIFRGHLLNKEDLILRKHILNIMCRFETSWEKESRQTEAVYEAIKHLQEMEQDGLVILKPFQLQVTEKGKAFIRNICMAFDARLWKNIPQTEIFSKTI